MNKQRPTKGANEQEWEHPARKRARLASDDEDELPSPRQKRPLSGHGHDHTDKDKDKSITIASVAKHLPQTVAPFLTKHIPSQYAPLGDPHGKSRTTQTLKDPNSKFCYRHRPDMLCRRQADEPTMDKLQKNLEAMTPEDQQGIVQVWSLFSVAPSKHRNLMLQGILAQCCFPQLSFLSTNVRELIRIDFLAALPSEVAFRILCFLDTTSLCKAAQVSRKWRQLADDDVVWHRMCEQHIDRKCTKCGWGLPMLERKRLRASKRLIQLRASGQGVDGSSDVVGDHVEGDEALNREQPITTSNGQTSPQLMRRPSLQGPTPSEFEKITRPWKDVYKDRFKVGTNWKHGRGKLEILRGHSNGVMAMHMYDHILATGSYDDTIKIWDLDTCKELRTLKGHTMGIRCLQLDESKLISGSLDKTLKVWNWRTGECVATYTGHQEGVVGLHFDANILVSGSIDKTARVWNFQDRTAFNLRGHTDWVNSVRIDTTSRTVFTASDDCTIKMWDLDTRRCLSTYEGHVGQVQQVLLLPAEFDADEGGGDSGNHTSDPGSPDSAFTSGSSYLGHGSQPSPVLLHRNLPANNHATTFETPLVDPFTDFPVDRPRPPRYILTSALDSTIRLWEVSTGRCVRTFFGHLEGVWALAADTLRIVSGAEDRTVKVWDPRTGKCERTYTGHRGPVTCIALSDSRMVSAGEDGEVRVYSFGD